MTDDDLRKLFDESKRHTETVYERTRSDVQQLAEGLLTLSEKMDRGFTAMRSGFTEVNARAGETPAHHPARRASPCNLVTL